MAAISLKPLWIGCLLFILLSSGPAAARTSLVALPLRQDTAVKLSSRGFTLVQEKRTLTFKKGVNNIDFSWQNVMIDPDSILFAPLGQTDGIRVLSVSYPPGESALIWDVYSPDDRQEEVMISYLLAHIDGITTYHAVADPDESFIHLKSYMVLRNFSGETFDRAAVSINNSVPHTTSVDHLETKRILVGEQSDIPIRKIYTWDALKMPHDPQRARAAVGIPVVYEILNSAESRLGKTALLEGKARIFQDDGNQGSIFLGEDTCPFTPVGDKARLHIGDSRDVVVTRKVMDSKRSRIRRDKKGNIQVYDETVAVHIIAENLKDRPMTLSVVETIDGHWESLDIPMTYRQLDHKTLQFDIRLAPGETKTLPLRYKILNIFSGSFSRYNRVSR